jgi:SAM-dependent methyltransferase
MKRAFDEQHSEFIDASQAVAPELERNLADVASLNRSLGSHRLVARFLSGWFQRRGCYRVLVLAAGAGDIPRVIADWCENRRISVQIDALEANPAALEIARAQGAKYSNIQWLRGNPLSFESGHTYDLVCSLALHRFSETDAIRLLRHGRKSSHHFVLFADLERSLGAYLGVWLAAALLLREPLARHDGRLSARRAFTWVEMHRLAAEAGWEDFGHARFLFCHQAVWLTERELGGIPAVVLPDTDGFPCPT